jgi:hypothetical protein
VTDRIDDEDLVTTTGLSSDPDRMDRWFRWILVSVLTLLLVAAAGGLLGVETASASASGGGLQLDVEYAATTRAGLATPFAISIASLDGAPLPSPLDVVVDAPYLEMFDENGLTPDPAEAWSDGRSVTWTFEPPEGAASLTVSFDARLEPAVQRGHEGRVAVMAGSRELVAVDFTTMVMP